MKDLYTIIKESEKKSQLSKKGAVGPLQVLIAIRLVLEWLVGLKFEYLLQDSKILFQCLRRHQTQILNRILNRKMINLAHALALIKLAFVTSQLKITANEWKFTS
jgi:hypothetical protein